MDCSHEEMDQNIKEEQISVEKSAEDNLDASDRNSESKVEKKFRIKPLINLYVPPHARRSDACIHYDTKPKERLKLKTGSEDTKICNNSSLLFQSDCDSQSNNSDRKKSRRIKKSSNKNKHLQHSKLCLEAKNNSVPTVHEPVCHNEAINNTLLVHPSISGSERLQSKIVTIVKNSSDPKNSDNESKMCNNSSLLFRIDDPYYGGSLNGYTSKKKQKRKKKESKNGDVNDEFDPYVLGGSSLVFTNTDKNQKNNKISYPSGSSLDSIVDFVNNFEQIRASIGWMHPNKDLITPNADLEPENLSRLTSEQFSSNNSEYTNKEQIIDNQLSKISKQTLTNNIEANSPECETLVSNLPNISSDEEYNSACESLSFNGLSGYNSTKKEMLCKLLPNDLSGCVHDHMKGSYVFTAVDKHNSDLKNCSCCNVENDNENLTDAVIDKCYITSSCDDTEKLTDAVLEHSSSAEISQVTEKLTNTVLVHDNCSAAKSQIPISASSECPMSLMGKEHVDFTSTDDKCRNISNVDPCDDYLQGVQNNCNARRTQAESPCLAPEEAENNSCSIIEIYGFSPEFKTEDILSSFKAFLERGFKVKWVDETHALGIFPSPAIAGEALKSTIPLLKIRPLSEATLESQKKARLITSSPTVSDSTHESRKKNKYIKLPPQVQRQESSLLAEEFAYAPGDSAPSEDNGDLGSAQSESHCLEPEEAENNSCSIIEIYGFPPEFITKDILKAFDAFLERGFKVKWVDDTHALGIFPTPAIADEALKSTIPFLKTRPLSEATLESQKKAELVISTPQVSEATLESKNKAKLIKSPPQVRHQVWSLLDPVAGGFADAPGDLAPSEDNDEFGNAQAKSRCLELEDAETTNSSIVEIYGFSPEFKTKDILMSFNAFLDRGFKVKWVDDTHALGIFPTPAIADEALRSPLPFLKVRPLCEATQESQNKAKLITLPPQLRPKTCSAMARRLVSGALGVKAVFTAEEKAAERELLKEARQRNEQKKLAAQQREAAWEGKF